MLVLCFAFRHRKVQLYYDVLATTSIRYISLEYVCGCFNTRGGGVMRARHYMYMYDKRIRKSGHSGRASSYSQISIPRSHVGLDQILCLLQLTPAAYLISRSAAGCCCGRMTAPGRGGSVP